MFADFIRYDAAFSTLSRQAVGTADQVRLFAAT